MGRRSEEGGEGKKEIKWMEKREGGGRKKEIKWMEK